MKLKSDSEGLLFLGLWLCPTQTLDEVEVGLIQDHYHLLDLATQLLWWRLSFFDKYLVEISKDYLQCLLMVSEMTYQTVISDRD